MCTHSFAELAGNAALFARGVSSEGVLATESGGDGALRQRSMVCSPRGHLPGVLCVLYLLEGVEDGVPIGTSAIVPRRA